MKTAITSLIIAAALTAGLSSCKNDDRTEWSGELAFSASVDDMTADKTRAAGSSFFAPGYEIKINVTTAAKPLTQYTYSFGSDGIFRGVPPFRFTLDDDYITTLEALWPADYDPAAPFITDQREIENYRKADRLRATGTLDGIMPTNTPVPLHFERENTMLQFELAGQNTAGLIIQSLLIELQDPTGTPQAYWAYCTTDNGNAELILPPNTRIQSTEGYLIGTLTVVPNDNYTIIFPATDITLEAGKRYLVTLTPQGYPMTLYASIGGWNQGEDGIGIPFQQPTPDIDGSFSINTPQQLITMSYLIRNYTDGSTFDWPTRTYVIADGLSALMTPELAALYVPVPTATYPSVVVQDEQGTAVTEITYGDALTLSLFQ